MPHNELAFRAGIKFFMKTAAEADNVIGKPVIMGAIETFLKSQGQEKTAENPAEGQGKGILDYITSNQHLTGGVIGAGLGGTLGAILTKSKGRGILPGALGGAALGAGAGALAPYLWSGGGAALPAISGKKPLTESERAVVAMRDKILKTIPGAAADVVGTTADYSNPLAHAIRAMGGKYDTGLAARTAISGLTGNGVPEGYNLTPTGKKALTVIDAINPVSVVRDWWKRR